ncbi:hypothetical protein ABZW10_32950 [Kitasatospora sp. NPDC004723]|uniref:hypothetical protein n=1 Tax=Kitasatospora sp. NPDC004723 TaxID=3154288 RepID=UPI0033A744F5
MSATTAAADALVRDAQQHLSGALGGSTEQNASLLAGGPSPWQPNSDAGSGSSSNSSGGGRG